MSSWVSPGTPRELRFQSDQNYKVRRARQKLYCGCGGASAVDAAVGWRIHQKARLSRRAEKLQAQLEATRPRNQTIEQPVIAPEPDEPTQPSLDRKMLNRKIEPKPQPVHVTPQPGRNELCPCNSGLKYKRCCLNQPSAARAAA